MRNTSGSSTGCFDPADLAKFGNIGEHGPEHADLFFKYYGALRLHRRRRRRRQFLWGGATA
ncbi:hypothetical protein RM530_12020 [Algiphilus sp. W345]|uniref:Uncharacterized protein n=1 Tax=Banduia mediterranea TaxID=3075609 RepID=A0ABU2WLJ7_9GAMM|nr:hypothetical protein [Algiphilus sp. W345]MDT0498084.1 hypothetical protein [Algiphilus sp. W345]